MKKKWGRFLKKACIFSLITFLTVFSFLSDPHFQKAINRFLGIFLDLAARRMKPLAVVTWSRELRWINSRQIILFWNAEHLKTNLHIKFLNVEWIYWKEREKTTTTKKPQANNNKKTQCHLIFVQKLLIVASFFIHKSVSFTHPMLSVSFSVPKSCPSFLVLLPLLRFIGCSIIEVLQNDIERQVSK